MNEYQERALRIADAWRRVRAAEDLQVGWVSCSELLAKALDADLDHAHLVRFASRAGLLADEIAKREVLLPATHGSMLAHGVANRVMWEVLRAREQDDRTLDVFDALVMLDELAWEDVQK